VFTNAHVVAGATSVQVMLDDGSTASATLVAASDDDIALVKVQDASGLQAAELGSSSDIKVGDPVVAIGNALNLGGQPSVTEGIVSAKNRDIQTREGTIKNLIQTDAAINPGNSGGPLLNAGGQVVGINTAIIKDAQNIGFAISIDSIKPLIDDLKNGKGTVTPDTAFLGVSTQSIGDVNAATIERYKVGAESGAFVSDVVTDSAAAVAGLQPGDVITSIDGQAIASSADVGPVIRKKKAGDQVVVEYEREGQPQRATVTLKSRGG
jgi:S1-C subfamily serine protease